SAIAQVGAGLERELVERERPADACRHDERKPADVPGSRALEQRAQRGAVLWSSKRQRADDCIAWPCTDREHERTVFDGAAAQEANAFLRGLHARHAVAA